MRPFRGVAWPCAIVLLAAGALPGQAAWNNVFQVCCHSCGTPSVSAYGGCCDPCPQPCCPPQQVCTTRYVQRCYYEPVTCYQTRTYYEPVTTYRTSYYWEPVTSYRYSYYRDPCTGCCQQVACPTTCYRLRSQCCPVTSYLQRCCQVPVTTYQQRFYYEPVTTCCQVSCASPCPPAAAPPCNGTAAPPAVQDRGTAAPPAVGDHPSGAGSSYQRYAPMPQAGNGRQLAPAVPTTPGQAAPARLAPPAVKFERIVAIPSPNVEGQVVRADKLPEPSARLLFVSADRQGARQDVTADRDGQFRTTLASGGWLVYLRDGDGKLTFHSRIDVRDNQPKQVLLTSR
ncbi:MAG TPA: hypothetical protein VFA26_25500 [Gemmataceae bacterium]|nr:hypothetical protein [Gemmataceae bacterium]